MVSPPTDARNTVKVDKRRPRNTFELRLGSRVDLIEEHHDGEVTTLILKRRPRVELV